MDSKVINRLRALYTVNTTEGLIFNQQGKEVGRRNHAGYYFTQVLVEGKWVTVLRSHIVWWAYYGEWPTQRIDHEDRNRSNDRITNLRYASAHANALNKEASLTRPLPPGVYLSDNKTKPYVAKARDTYLGYYHTPEEASNAYQEYWRQNP